MAFKIRKTKAGVRILGSASEKLGFYGVTPVVQPAHADQAVAADADGALRLVNRIRTDLIAVGLIKGAAILAVMFALFAFSVPVAASVNTDTVSITNTVAAETTATTGMGSAVNVQNAEHVTVFLSFKAANAGTSNVVLTLARSPTGVTWETTPQIPLTVAANGTNTVNFMTNITKEVIGACGYIKAVSLQNAQTNALSSIVLQILQKRIR
ncbi:MAG: hypothetical protein AB9869_01240 [Verrucomicrobiia bacterium]